MTAIEGVACFIAETPFRESAMEVRRSITERNALYFSAE